MGFNLDDYEPVKDRITRFYKDHADGRIITDLITDPATLDKSAGFRASVYLAETLKATGYAYESQGGGVNRDAWVENAETSAIGRALANMDYCGTLRPSREEMEKCAAPRQAQPTPPPAATTAEYVTVKEALIDYMNADPPVFKNVAAVQKAMDAKDIKTMREALAVAKSRAAEMEGKQ